MCGAATTVGQLGVTSGSTRRAIDERMTRRRHRSLDDVIGDEPGVAGDAGKSAGAPGMQPGQAEEIDARRLRHAAMKFRLARVIETGTSSQRNSG